MQDVTKAFEIALNNLGIGAKAQSDDLLSALENENDEQVMDTGARKWKNLKLPAIYDSQDYRSHQYLGLVEVEEDWEDDEKWKQKKDIAENPNYLDQTLN